LSGYVIGTPLVSTAKKDVAGCAERDQKKRNERERTASRVNRVSIEIQRGRLCPSDRNPAKGPESLKKNGPAKKGEKEGIGKRHHRHRFGEYTVQAFGWTGGGCQINKGHKGRESGLSGEPRDRQ